MIDTPLRPTQSTSNAIRPTSPDFAPRTARAKTQAHQVYSSPISTVSKLCGTATLGEDDPNTNRPASATVCTRLNPSRPDLPTASLECPPVFESFPYCYLPSRNRNPREPAQSS